MCACHNRCTHTCVCVCVCIKETECVCVRVCVCLHACAHVHVLMHAWCPAEKPTAQIIASSSVASFLNASSSSSAELNGNTGVVYYLQTDDDWDVVLKKGTTSPYVPVLDSSNFTTWVASWTLSVTCSSKLQASVYDILPPAIATLKKLLANKRFFSDVQVCNGQLELYQTFLL